MKNLLLGVFLIVLLAGCSSDLGKVIASEKTAPPTINAEVLRVTNAEQLTDAWDYFSMNKKQPKVNFDEYDYYFVSMRVSSTCPFKLKDVKVNDDKKEINFYFHQKVGSCTADATPRTFVIEVDKNATTGLENATFIILEAER
ncbi:hypothetical protein V7147_13595 [Bacillus sp. JJ1521]|uniref:hypothetical protein n=1 Tax=Bacillus sp. JJ1521 TaxID=3122957 RepID=UPI002FFDBEEC